MSNATEASTDTSTFAVVDLDDGNAKSGTISALRDLTDAERDQLSRTYGRRLVYLPGGGKIGDRVTIDEDGGAEVCPASMTADDIRALRTEAAAAGDEAQVAICARALAGDADAIAECVRVRDDARAMDAAE